MRKLWEGRLGARTEQRLEAFTTSLDVDRRLWREDIEASLAHAAMLCDVGLLSDAEHALIEAGLRSVGEELERDEFVFNPADEDIHSAVERRLHEITGEVAGKLHTARSRNDQVATDLRLYAKKACDSLDSGIVELQQVLVQRADEHRDDLLPGYTHGQRAQVVSLGHHLLAYVEMFHRDAERLRQARERCDVLPLGSGALAATTLPIDRRAVAQRLHFKQLSANSMDAVSDRDFVVDIVAACSLLMVHLSRLSEELVLWCSSEFGYAELPDEFATGSSLMPQKKNPDVLELVRARAGRVNGDLMALLMTLKGLPLTYNRDLQEDKQPLFDAVDLAQASLDILAALLPTIRFNTDAMRAAASDPALVATDIAEYLVQQGVPFRQAHGIVGSAVRQTIAQGRSLADLELFEWRALCDRCGPEIRSLFDQGALLERRDVPGGPGPRSVADQLARARAMLGAARD